VHTQLQIHGRTIDAVILSFRAPYAVENATENYSASTVSCHHADSEPGPNADVARGGTVQIDAVGLLQASCTRSVTIKVQYAHSLVLSGLPTYTTIGTATIHEPAGTHLPALAKPPTGKTLKALCGADKLLRICRHLR
jgi:hypothetical protein